jgi:hypothetical protein
MVKALFETPCISAAKTVMETTPTRKPVADNRKPERRSWKCVGGK